MESDTPLVAHVSGLEESLTLSERKSVPASPDNPELRSCVKVEVAVLGFPS